MFDERQVQQLLDEILDSERTPEDVCGQFPELLPQVRERWRQMCRLEAELEALFPSPGVGTTSAEDSTNFPRIPGYEIEGELGRGGMGVVYKARHLRLGRSVALKMMLAGVYAGPNERTRFQREAEAVAGLRHANIVQVYDVSECDGRPYFTMEFVEGGSLAQKLEAAPLPLREAAALVATLAEAVQVAHQGGIVHRDLKPGNVLLTTDATPKISDFGLARRLQDVNGLTQTGAHVGTPCYMAPEQARGKTNALGPAVDIYALGAILYETLTRRPSFRGETPTETVLQAIYNEPVPPSRWNAKVPRDLETICLKCLHKEPQQRYTTAKALAEDIQRFLRGEAIEARPEGRLARFLRAVRRRPALVVGLTGLVLLATALIVGGVWIRLERLANDRTQEQLDRLDRARRDQEFVTRLEEIRLKRAAVVEGKFSRKANNAQADREYEAAFREAGIGEISDDPLVFAARIAASNIRTALVAALDDWAASCPDQTRQDRLLEVARRADADPTDLDNRFRDPAVWKNCAALTELAKTACAANPSVQLLVALGQRLRDAGGDAIPFLTQVQEKYPGDFWVNLILADTLGATNPGEAVRYYQAALAIQPASALVYNNLGRALAVNGRVTEAKGCFQHALLIDPKLAAAHANLGNALTGKGQSAESLQHLEQAIRLAPNFANFHSNLGGALFKARRPSEAIDQFREALRLDPDYDTAETGLGVVLQSEGRVDEGIEHHRRALRINPDSAIAHNNLGMALQIQGKIDEASDHFREALRIDPNYASAYTGLGNGMASRGQFEAAIKHYREALRLDANYAPAHTGLANTLTATDRPLEAIEHYRQAARLEHENARAQYNFALALATIGRTDEAIEPFEQALRIDSKLAEAHGALAVALLEQGRIGESRTALIRCLDLLPPSDARRQALAQQVQRCDRWLTLEGRLPAVFQGRDKPADVSETFQFAELCRLRRQSVAAANFFLTGFALKPQWAEDPRNGLRYHAARCAACAGCGRGEGAAILGEAERARWRSQARAWLRAELAAWENKLDSDPAAYRARVRRTLTYWGYDPDLAGIREASALEKLSAEEGKACLGLWEEVDAVLNRAKEAK